MKQSGDADRMKLRFDTFKPLREINLVVLVSPCGNGHFENVENGVLLNPGEQVVNLVNGKIPYVQYVDGAVAGLNG